MYPFSCLSTFYCQCKRNSCQLSRIVPVNSPVLTVFYNSTPINITLDSGATTSFVTEKLCKTLNIRIQPNGQLARLGDGCTTIASKGEINVTFTRGKWSVKFRAIVVEKLNTDIYGGMNFFVENDISIRPKTGEIKLLDKYTIYQTNVIMPPPQMKELQIQRSTTIPLNFKQILFPVLPQIWKETNAVGNSPSLSSKEKHNDESCLNVIVPPEFENDKFVMIYPRLENKNEIWPPPQLCPIVNGSICLTNTSAEPISIPNDVNLLDFIHTDMVDVENVKQEAEFNYRSAKDSSDHNVNICSSEVFSKQGQENAAGIDLTRAPAHLQDKLRKAHLKYSDVFEPDLSTGYNGYSGVHEVKLRFADENRPLMTKTHVPKWAGKHDNIKQKKMDQLEAQNVLLDPYKHNIPIKLISPCFLRLKARAKNKEMEECDLSEIRWIVSPGQLNPHLKQLFTNTVTKEDLFTFKSEKPHCIEFDLYEGYFQNHICKEDWGYLAVETPFKGLRVLTRSGQGLLNQEIEMNQLITKVLGKEIAKKNVILQADDGQVGGETQDDAVDNWINVLKLCSLNNIKINAKKVKILPESSLIHGWVFKDGHVEPSPHRALAILDIKPPTTVGEMRTYMGVYKTFFPAMKRLSNLMDPFDKLCGGRKSKETLEWTDELDKHFKDTQRIAQTDIEKLALPHPNEQLFVVPDAASRPPGIGFILFVNRDPPEPVMFVNWKLPDSHLSWSPCELEGFGASVAVAKCSFYILRSTKPTLVFPDNKQVIQAFNKLKKGRFSTSQRLATFSNNMQKYPIQMQHGSGKMLQNLGSDYISRNITECANDKCELCKFAKEKGDSILASITNKITRKHHKPSTLDLSSLSHHWSAALDNIEIPIGNLVAWSKVQSNDNSIRKAIEYKKSGQSPPKSDKVLDMSEVRHYTIHCKYNSSNNLLVKEEDIPLDHRKKQKIVVPKWFLKPLLVQMHMDQTCPEPSQLKKIFDRYFHGFKVGDIFKEVSDECPRCDARRKIPKELRHFTSVTNPASPGTFFVSDVLRRSKQFIMVTRDAFSDFVTSSIIKSERAEDLKEGIIATTSTVRRQSAIVVRVDSAPGFQSLTSKNNDDLKKLKISLELSNPNNKNGLAIVDKAIQELEKEITILSPECKEITSSDLAKATLVLNSRVRNRNMSSHEILFSREQVSGENLKLDDEGLRNNKMLKKTENHPYSEKSKYPSMIEPLDAKAVKGNFVYLKSEGDKHNLRNKYLVVDSGEYDASIVKLLHALDDNLQTKLSSKILRVKQTDIYQATENRKHHAAEKAKDVSTEKEDEDDDFLEEDKVTELTTRSYKNLPPQQVWSPFSQIYESSDDEEDIPAINNIIECNLIEPGNNYEDVANGNLNLSEFYEHAENDENISINTFAHEPQDQSNSSEQPDSTMQQKPESSISDSNEVTIEEEFEAIQDGTPPTPDELFNPSLPNPPVLPLAGDKISFVDFDAQPPTVVHATMDRMYKTVQRRHPGWFNIIRDDGHLTPGSIRLDDRRWRFYEDQEGDITHETLDDVVLDQNHDKAFSTETPENEQLPIPFPEVLNLDHVLPLTSTPASSTTPLTQIPQRLNAVRPRGFLPMEFEDSPLAPSPTRSRLKKVMHDGAKHLKKVLALDEKNSSNSTEGDLDDRQGGGGR